jgi:lipopolysaccharide biosynthesis glycosyltransferase
MSSQRPKPKGFNNLINQYQQQHPASSNTPIPMPMPKPPPPPMPKPPLMPKSIPPPPPMPSESKYISSNYHHQNHIPMSSNHPKKERCAFAIIHFGSNPVYLELEMYFFKMLRQYTNNDILYLYSINDTPVSFVDAIKPLVTDVIPYDDKNITYDVTFKSGYTNFNTLRTCNFIFAYTIEKYDKVCIIESDMVIMRTLDSIFDLQIPAVLTYYIGDKNLKYNDRINNKPSEVIAKCKESGRINGGVMVIYPSMVLFNTYKDKLKDVVQQECKYPNETLFEYVNNTYYNLPIQYNLSHYLAKPYKLDQYRLSTKDIYIFHFNETKYKHIDIIKNPIDENGDNWLEIIQQDKKYEVKKFPILHYKNTTYDRYKLEIEPIIEAIKNPIIKQLESISLSKDEIRPASPVKYEIRPDSLVSLINGMSNLELTNEIKPKKKCLKGTRRNKKTGECVPNKVKSNSSKSSTSSKSSSSKSSGSKSKKATITRKRCSNGYKRNKKTGECDPVI